MDNSKIIVNPNDNPEISSMPKELFKELPDRTDIHDAAFETKPVSFLKDSFSRFVKNKGSVVGAIVILLIALYAIVTPLVSPFAKIAAANPIDYPSGFGDTHYSNVLPYAEMFKGTGFWDGTTTKTLNKEKYEMALLNDSNHPYVEKLLSVDVQQIGMSKTEMYTFRANSYFENNIDKEIKLSQSEFEALEAYDLEHNTEETRIMKKMVDVDGYLADYRTYLESKGTYEENSINKTLDAMRNYYITNNKSAFYAITAEIKGQLTDIVGKFKPIYNTDGSVQTIYKKDASGNEVRYEVLGSGQIQVRVDYFDYFTYLRGFKPYYLFGANSQGKDICLRLAQGTCFSLLLGIVISAINFIIGLIWGAISGYYGGYVDLTMERITDIISNIPSLIILTITSVQFTNNPIFSTDSMKGWTIILSFLIAFVYSGWIGVAGTTRMQFYRFKGQEYVLASRTLGAKDSRLIFKHILPNAAGTLVTSSVLMIPSVIFSESTLSYLGIVDFDQGNLSSIGTLLNEGQLFIKDYPHEILFPCIIISLLMICFNLFGNGLRDAFNTSLKGAED